MIISSTSDLQKYVPVNEKFYFDKFSPFINKAINSFTRKYIGNLHEELQDVQSDEDQPTTQAREHLKNAIANFSFYLYLPYYMVQMDSSGISSLQNENRKAVEWWQAADIKRELLRAGHESMDLLLNILEKNPSISSEYTNNFSPIYKEILVQNADEFSKFYNIYNSRQTFLALVPSIKLAEKQVLNKFITQDFIEELKTDISSDENKKLVKEYLQNAIVYITISKIYHEGFFHFDASGVKLKFDILPNEKVQAIDYGKPAEQLQRAIKSYIDNATQLTLLAKDIIQEHFSDKLITTPSTKASTIGSGGIIGI